MAAISLGAQVVGTSGLSAAAAKVARRLTAAPCYSSSDALMAVCPGVTAQVVLGGLHDAGVFSKAAAVHAALVVLEGPDDVFCAAGARALVALVAAAADTGFGQFAHRRVVHAHHGSPVSTRRRVLVAFGAAVELDGTFQFPAEAEAAACVGDIMWPSVEVPSRCWDSRPWVRFPAGAMEGWRQQDLRSRLRRRGVRTVVPGTAQTSAAPVWLVPG